MQTSTKHSTKQYKFCTRFFYCLSFLLAKRLYEETPSVWTFCISDLYFGRDEYACFNLFGLKASAVHLSNTSCLSRQYLEKSQKSLIYQWFCSSSRCLLHHDYTILERALNDISEVTCFCQNNGHCPKDSTIILKLLLLIISPPVCD